MSKRIIACGSIMFILFVCILFMRKNCILANQNEDISMVSRLSEVPRYNGNNNESSIIFQDAQLISGGKKLVVFIFNNGGKLS